MLGRYLLSFVLGTVVTFILFAIMITMIHISQQPLGNEASFNMVDFIRQKRDRDLSLDELKPEPPPLPSAPPPPARMQLDKFATSTISQSILPGTNIDVPEGFELGGQGISIGAGGGDYLPIAQVAPQYPRDALMKGIEGWVLVEFTIGTEGQVINPAIVKSEPPGVFDDAALGAVKRFRFKPRTVGTTPVAVRGVQNRIKFRLQR